MIIHSRTRQLGMDGRATAPLLVFAIKTSTFNPMKLEPKPAGHGYGALGLWVNDIDACGHIIGRTEIRLRRTAEGSVRYIHRDYRIEYRHKGCSY